MKTLSSLLIILLTFSSAHAQDFDELKNMEKYSGFFDFYYDNEKDKIYLLVENPGEEFLYVHSLSSGLGSNDIGLDRGQIGGEAVVYFRKSGENMLLVQPNLSYRAETDNLQERKAVEEAFARSVLYSFKIKEEKNGRYLINLGDMLFSDMHHVSETLKEMKEGTYSLDRDRSAIELSRTRAFPENVEFDVMLTYTGTPEGSKLRTVTPDPHNITVNQHHSFVKLPDDNYKPRIFHPQSGCIPISYMDYSTPVYKPIEKRYIIRHRLEKKNPELEISEPVEPIIYYLDNGTPEPVRSALLEGGSWWDEAFRAAGYKNAFRLEMLPEDADPLDVRYNVIQWVHRSTRGWSYGNAVVDPRTGEIIKGHVSLGSLRVRQDFMIAQALVNKPFASNDTNHQAMMDLALARIRQLSAHEIGHTLGFTHNFAASTHDRSSVMDYPHPLLKVENGEVVMNDAYDEGIGEWDKVTVAYAYADIRNNEEDSLKKILSEARAKGFRFISDYDARAASGAHPYAHLWDNGKDAVNEFENVLEVRATAIANFSVDNIRKGEPLSVLEDVFVPLYFFHRYQVEAVSKLVGGLEYEYTVKGDNTDAPHPLDADIQREALSSLVNSLSPGILMIPEDKLKLFPPRAYGYPVTGESFRRMTGVTFDVIAPAASMANYTLAFLLLPERTNRIVQQHAVYEEQPGLEEIISTLLEKTIKATPSGEGYREEIMHTVNFIVIDHLISLSKNDKAYPQVKAIARNSIKELKSWLENEEEVPFSDTYRLAYLRQIKDDKATEIKNIADLPPGSPIGLNFSCSFR